MVRLTNTKTIVAYYALQYLDQRFTCPFCHGEYASRAALQQHAISCSVRLLGLPSGASAEELVNGFRERVREFLTADEIGGSNKPPRPRKTASLKIRKRPNPEVPGRRIIL